MRGCDRPAVALAGRNKGSGRGSERTSMIRSSRLSSSAMPSPSRSVGRGTSDGSRSVFGGAGCLSGASLKTMSSGRDLGAIGW